uniref:Uncharacterized protein n=1 Tax=Anguilla anguilla TaxID=7936 RepID=A0A0E9XK14_ANGAN
MENINLIILIQHSSIYSIIHFMITANVFFIMHVCSGTSTHSVSLSLSLSLNFSIFNSI